MIVKEGIKVLALEFVMTPLSILNVYLILPLIFSIILTLIFFRDPEREIGNSVVSPADGKIDYVEGNRIEIFMNILDCHVNRSPVEGVIREIVYFKGSKFPAFLRVKEPERNEITIENEYGTFKVVQIAGFLSRRILCFVKEGDFVRKGERIGMIIMGSRVALEVPDGFTFVKKVGDRVKAGETIAVKSC